MFRREQVVPTGHAPDPRAGSFLLRRRPRPWLSSGTLLLWLAVLGGAHGSVVFGQAPHESGVEDTHHNAGSAAPNEPSPTPDPRLRTQLRWTAPGGCPSGAAITAAVDELLSRRAFLPEDAAESPELIAEGLLSRAGQGWQAELTLRTAQGRALGRRTITLEAPRCAESLRSIALVLSLMIDVDREEIALRITEMEPDAPAISTESAPSPPSATSDGAAPSPPEEETEARHIAPTLWRGHLGAGGGALHGMVPGTVATFGLHGGLSVGPWWIEGWFDLTSRGRAHLPTDDASTPSVVASAGFGGVRACGLPLYRGVLQLGVCAALAVGWTRAEGQGLAMNRQATRTQAMVGLSLLARVRLSRRFALRFDGGVRALAARDRLRLAPMGEPVVVFTPWALLPHGRLSVEFHWP